MKMAPISRSIGIASGVVMAAILAAGCASSPTTQPSSSAPTATNSTGSSAPPAPASKSAAASGYVSLADYEGNKAAYSSGDVVLFFNATWCSTCQAATKSFKASAGDWPAGLTIVSADYDDNSELKKKYGVTIQHTFVQISPDGAQIKKWSGSQDVAQVQAQV